MLHAAVLSLLSSLLAAAPAPDARPVLLLYPIESTAKGTPPAMITALTRRVAEALRGSGGVQVVLFQESAPLLRRAVADQTALGNREAAVPERGTLVARSAGATHVGRGTITAYMPAAESRPGRAALRFTVTRVASERERSTEAEAPVAPRAKPEAVAETLARAVAESFARDLLPSLSVERPGDREGALATRLRRGRHAMAVGGLDEAYRLLSEAVRQAPRDPAANAAYGDLLVRFGRLAGAIAAYRQSLLFEPGNAEVRRQLLRALEAHGLMEDLATESRRADRAGGQRRGGLAPAGPRVPGSGPG